MGAVTADQGTPSGVLAYAMSFLRTSRTPELETIIPDEDIPTGWAEGLSRQTDSFTLFDVRVITSGAGAPALTWWGWRPPKTDSGVAGGDRWSFGQVRTDRTAASAAEQRVSWNTWAVTYDE